MKTPNALDNRVRHRDRAKRIISSFGTPRRKEEEKNEKKEGQALSKSQPLKRYGPPINPLSVAEFNLLLKRDPCSSLLSRNKLQPNWGSPYGVLVLFRLPIPTFQNPSSRSCLVLVPGLV
ncbi:hypothetical protein SODALDRAFT_77888 [Sodiomyces alkalinus F11]|uniref:Uncharacterized protein n=1 Tax=Sodiomyces alkalinus (strain CBS 110278 / VKM F-3762 / F11) TaxID=1314773 RepID=A0A3N2PKR3_SODAK|nr:hypothetical protein SODALDRAFT_77888 [Sodiomyces alkalinus F11]ROT35121.1 hypothetical protein SODALDRAFT_77888 [Sodiomyces alkalinus F11]